MAEEKKKEKEESKELDSLEKEELKIKKELEKIEKETQVEVEGIKINKFSKICPNCKSFNVQVGYSPSPAYGVPEYICADCGFKANIFPEINIHEKKETQEEKKENNGKEEKKEEK